MTAGAFEIVVAYILRFAWRVVCNLKSMTPGCLLVALFFPVTIPAYLVAIAFHHYFLQDLRLRRKMKASGRRISRGDVPDHGTIVVDCAAFNHGRFQIWWTSDDIARLSAMPIPVGPPGFSETDDLDKYVWPPFERWLWYRYLDPVDGAAKLVFCTLKTVDTEKIQAWFPKCVVIESFTGGKVFEEFSKGPCVKKISK